jgi:hypothetical protein
VWGGVEVHVDGHIEAVELAALPERVARAGARFCEGFWPAALDDVRNWLIWRSLGNSRNWLIR